MEMINIRGQNLDNQANQIKKMKSQEIFNNEKGDGRSVQIRSANRRTACKNKQNIS